VAVTREGVHGRRDPEAVEDALEGRRPGTLGVRVAEVGGAHECALGGDLRLGPRLGLRVEDDHAAVLETVDGERGIEVLLLAPGERPRREPEVVRALVEQGLATLLDRALGLRWWQRALQDVDDRHAVPAQRSRHAAGHVLPETALQGGGIGGVGAEQVREAEEPDVEQRAEGVDATSGPGLGLGVVHHDPGLHRAVDGHEGAEILALALRVLTDDRLAEVDALLEERLPALGDDARTGVACENERGGCREREGGPDGPPP
jgi:hypothetical protein